MTPLITAAPEKHHLSHLLLTVLLLLRGRTADGAENRSETASSVPSVSSGRDMVVKEGSNTLIQCNVTGGLGDVRWFDPKGRPLGEDAGRMRRRSESQKDFVWQLL